MNARIYLLFFGLVIISSCNKEDQTSTVKSEVEITTHKKDFARSETKFKILKSGETGILADNKVKETAGFNHFLWASIYNGSGVGVADFNNDGLPDIYVGQNMTSDKLYINKGDMNFEDISKTAFTFDNRWTSGVSVVDVNNDGWMDIYVCKFGPSKNPEDRKNQLLVNQKDNTFKDEAREYGLDDKGFTTQAAFFDADNDGDLDLFVVNQQPDSRFLQQKQPSTQEKKAFYSNKFYIRNKRGLYVDATEEWGVTSFAPGLNVLVNDINEDGFLDLYVSNDYENPDFIYINQRGEKFVNELESRTGHISNFSMGSDVADVNNDGLNDIGVLDMSSNDHYRSKTNMGAMNEDAFWANVDKGNYFQYMFNSLQLNQGEGYFSEVAQMAGIAQTDWSWSILFEDFNGDGYKDCYVTNGIKRDIRNNDFIQSVVTNLSEGKNEFQTLELIKKIPSNPISNFYFENSGGIKFVDKSKVSGAYDPNFSTGAAIADFDRDGDLDIFTSVSEHPSVILENVSNPNSKIYQYQIKKEEINDWLYAEFVLETDCGIQRKDFVPVRGYLSSAIDYIQFSVPNDCYIKSSYIKTRNASYKLPTGKSGEVTVIEKDTAKPIKLNRERNSGYFVETNVLEHKHIENKYNDYKVEVLLPHKLSENGPCSATGDIDGDGVNEVFVGGSYGKTACLYTYDGGKWVTTNTDLFNRISISENQNALFFDADSDGDLDLYLVNGGNEKESASNEWLIDQLLLNDGKGNFSLDSAFPKIGRNTGVAIDMDIDSDGDLDLVVFGAHKIGSYPAHYDSYILENSGGAFSLSDKLDVGLDQINLVSDALKVDYNDDGKDDIVAVGAWSAPYVLIADGSKIKYDAPQELEALSSWWNTIAKGDLNGDGREELILGSFGENNKFHPSKKKPLEIFGKDFDGSGSNDVVLAKHYKDKVVPTRGRECSSQQIPNIQDKFPTYNEFALAGLDDILGENELEKSVHRKITSMSHVVLWNTATGWEIDELPEEAQTAPLKGITMMDVNGDGIQDAIGIGNHYGAEVETARYDAGYGFVLLGDKGRQLKYVTPKKAGIWFRGDGRSIEQVDIKGTKQILAFFNNSKAKSYRLK